jgi:hypothetical protein
MSEPCVEDQCRRRGARGTYCPLFPLISRARLTHRPDDGGSTDLWNVSKLTPVCMALQPRKRPSSYSPLWEPQVILLHSVSGSINISRCLIHATASDQNKSVLTFTSTPTMSSWHRAWAHEELYIYIPILCMIDETMKNVKPGDRTSNRI